MTTEIDEVFKRSEKIASDGLNEYQREEQRRLAVYELLKQQRLQRESEK
jgi:hypothetical protein